MNYRFFTITSLTFLLINIQISAQSIWGKISNLENQSLPYANITLHKVDQPEILKGTMANEEGKFLIKDTAPGIYDLKISMIGYEQKLLKEIRVENPEKHLNLGIIFMKTTDYKLSEVLVKSNFGVTNMSPGRVTYNSSNLNSQRGGTGGDILKNMPSIFMGGSPNHNRDVRYRGLGNSYTQVLVNGRKVGISGNNRESVVDIIPAEKIDYIEIVSNPTSEYQSDGINGLINIITKKNSKYNLHGNISAGIDNNEGHSGDISLFNSINNLDLGIQATRLKRFIDKPKDVEKVNYKTDVFDGTQNQSELEKKYFENDILNANLKYRLSSRSYLVLEGTFGSQQEDKTKNLNSFSFEQDYSFKENKIENTEEDKYSRFNEYFVEAGHTFSDYSELKANFSYNPSTQNNNKSSAENKYDVNGNLISANPALKKEFENIKLHDAAGNLNYRFTLEGIGTIKTGYSFASINRDGAKTKNEYDYKISSWKISAAGLDNFNLEEQTHSLFVDAKINFLNFNINPGVRVEKTNINSKSVLDNFENSGNYFIVMPNINTIYNLDSTQYLTAAVGRRIRRPGFNDMNPFIDTNDPLKIKIGNPALKPEMAWIYEIGYMKNFKSFNAGVNIFYRDINDVIQKVISTNADGIFVERPQNFSSAYLAGIELITAIRITNWWQLNGAYSQFDSKVTDSSFDGDALKDQVKWTAKILTDFSFPYEIHLQIAGSYLGPKPSSLQYEDKIFSVDAGLTKAIEGFGQITLRVADLFDTLKKVKNNRAGLSTSREVENTTGRIVTLTTTWSF
jgi:outer membrane receptor for ferrienterochelin and colicin